MGRCLNIISQPSISTCCNGKANLYCSIIIPHPLATQGLHLRSTLLNDSKFMTHEKISAANLLHHLRQALSRSQLVSHETSSAAIKDEKIFKDVKGDS